MNHLVTGGAGFIGSHLARRLLARGDHVTVVDNLTGGWESNIPVGAEFVHADLAKDDVDYLVADSDCVWHLAAYAAEGLSHWVRQFNYENNVVASARLVTAAVKHQIRHFYFTSSMAVYGEQSPPFVETMRPAPLDPYGIAKWTVEQDLAVANRMHGLPYTIFRPHNVYGPGQNIGDPYRNVVGILIRQALSGEPLTVFGSGEQTRAFSYVSDIVDPMVAALDRDTSGFTINLGGEQVITIGELAHRISDFFPGSGVVNLPPRVEVEHAFSDHGLARSLLGFRPLVGLDEGLERMVGWAGSVGVRWSVTPRLEHEIDLPVFWQSVAV